MRGPDGELLVDAILQERYKVTSLVNKSPASRTYKCIDTKRNKSIFLKEMLTAFNDPSLRQQAIEQFKCEAKILFKLRHENLPKFEDYFDYEGNRYLTFDYIEGSRLNEIVERSSTFLPEKQVLDWGIELCKVLSYLHNTKPNPVIFRDLSPQSTLLSTDKKLKLIDFGIAKIYEADAKTMGIAKTMTPHYSPIEQHAGTTDERSDIYSLGATLYYLITKKPPMDCVERIIDDEPMESPAKYNSTISPALENIIMKAMEVDKKDRFQKIEDMEEELKKVDLSKTRKMDRETLAEQSNTFSPEKYSHARDEIVSRNREAAKPTPATPSDKKAVSHRPISVRRGQDGVTYPTNPLPDIQDAPARSEERRVGKECRSRWSPYH